MTIYLIRHTSVNVEPGMCYGHTDVPLADSFPDECKRVRQKLPDLTDVIVYSSPLQRCQRLAQALTSAPIRSDRRLMELHFGAWEMRRWDDIGIGALNQLTSDVVHQRSPGGESYMDAFHRAVAFWDELPREDAENILVVTHSGIVRAFVAYLLDIPLEKSLLLGVDYGGVTKIEILEQTPVVQYVNR